MVNKQPLGSSAPVWQLGDHDSCEHYRAACELAAGESLALEEKTADGSENTLEAHDKGGRCRIESALCYYLKRKGYST